jgi:DNA-directed RNA polymerase specialized sigma subunit
LKPRKRLAARRKAYERERSTRRSEETKERNALVVGDALSGTFTLAEIAKEYGLSVSYVKRLVRVAA